jgi:beta-galactosidase
MRYYGCAYYPEYWGRARFERDAKLMRDAGINLARIGEFAWSRMEPEEGRFDLDWLHECLETLGAYGVQVLACTPTAAPPAWLTTAYPDTLNVRADGRRNAHGSRRHYCYTSDTYRRHTARIVSRLATELARHKNLAGWQLDNEFGPENGWCHCENCQARFQAWLQRKYGSLAELNRRWRCGFWSMDYTDWRQIRLAEDPWNSYSSRVLDSKRFFSASITEYAHFQAALIREAHRGVLVTTNGMGPVFGPIDYYKLFAGLDVACDDLYFDIGTMDTNVAAMHVFRSLKPGKRYWITETGSGALDHGKPPHKDQFRAWAWSILAHGGDAELIFRWRSCLSGQEQELQGILEHSGRPRHRYAAVKRCFSEMRKLCEQMGELPLPEVPVAIVQDYEVLWGYEASRIGKEVGYLNLLYRLHRELYDRHVAADIIPPDRSLSGYRLVILPSLMMIRPEFAARIKTFVQKGGVCLAVGQIGMRDECDNYLPSPGPQHLQDLLGVLIEGGMYLGSHVGPEEGLWVPEHKATHPEVAVAGKLAGAAERGSTKTWIADLTLNGGRALLSFDGEAYAGQPAVVERRTGRGWTVYAGAVDLDDHLRGRLMDYVLTAARVRRGPVTPRHVEVTTRGDYTFIINHTDAPVTVEVGAKGKALLGTCRNGVAELGPYGVVVWGARS